MWNLIQLPRTILFNGVLLFSTSSHSLYLFCCCCFFPLLCQENQDNFCFILISHSRPSRANKTLFCKWTFIYPQSLYRIVNSCVPKFYFILYLFLQFSLVLVVAVLSLLHQHHEPLRKPPDYSHRAIHPHSHRTYLGMHLGLSNYPPEVPYSEIYIHL